MLSNNRLWNLHDATNALKIENEMANCLNTDGQMLMLTFPDPKLNRDIVKSFAPSILNVEFRVPPTPRYCFVQLTEIADSKQIRENLSKIHFGTGTIIAEHLNMVQKPSLLVQPEDIDPYILYIGNLPIKLSARRIKEHFVGCSNIRIGFRRIGKHQRYAFVQYTSVSESINAFRNAFNWNTGEQSLVVRFHRSTNRDQFSDFNEEINLQENAASEISSIETLSDSETVPVSLNIIEDIKPTIFIDSRATSPSSNYTVQNNSINSEQLLNISGNDNITIKTERESNHLNGLPLKIEPILESRIGNNSSPQLLAPRTSYSNGLLDEDGSQNSSEIEYYERNMTSEDDDDDHNHDEYNDNNENFDGEDNHFDAENTQIIKRQRLSIDEPIDIKPTIVPPLPLPDTNPFSTRYYLHSRSTGDPELDRLFDGLNPDDGFHL